MVKEYFGSGMTEEEEKDFLSLNEEEQRIRTIELLERKEKSFPGVKKRFVRSGRDIFEAIRSSKNLSRQKNSDLINFEVNKIIEEEPDFDDETLKILKDEFLKNYKPNI